MNKDQRKFLTDKIEQNFKKKLNELDATRPVAPSMAAFLLQDVMSGQFLLRSVEEIRERIMEHAKGCAVSKRDFISESNTWGSKVKTYSLTIDPTLLFILPRDFQDLQDDYNDAIKEYNMKVDAITAHKDTLVMRVQLATDKNLDDIISQVDSMGSLRLENFSMSNALLLTNGNQENSPTEN